MSTRKARPAQGMEQHTLTVEIDHTQVAPADLAVADAVAIATAPEAPEAPITDADRHNALVTIMGENVKSAIAACDSLSDSEQANKTAYGQIIDSLSAIIADTSEATVLEVVEYYLNNQPKGLSKHTANSRRNALKKAFKRQFETSVLEWEYSNKRMRYDVWSTEAPDAETKATTALIKALDANVKAKVSREDIMEMIEAYFGE